ncbi:hypothetical protein GCM10025880_59690 [Methylorubrum aminovorans]|nr:hypothetical protein GCM10025880_59690 [Methylorubrum aminovorans]
MRSSPMQWLPMRVRSGGRTPAPRRTTETVSPASIPERAAGTAKKPSAWEKAVTEPEPFGSGRATGPSCPLAREAITNSVRPSSEASRCGRRAGTASSSRGGSPASARTSGTTNSWNVNIAEVGKPGSTTTALPSDTARQSGLPGFSATP